jgi:hypothetical protein
LLIVSLFHRTAKPEIVLDPIGQFAGRTHQFIFGAPILQFIPALGANQLVEKSIR